MTETAVYLEAAEHARAARDAAQEVRRHAGALKYHPATGAATEPPAGLRDALGRLRVILGGVERWSGSLSGERARVEKSVGPLRAALDALDATLRAPERVPLDAPYGLGSPRRPHPGAQATWVAERAENLARELLAIAIEAANATGREALPPRDPTAASRAGDREDQAL